MIPQIENSLKEDLTIISYPSKTYKLKNNQITGKVDDIEAIKQAIEHILSIERYAYLIYDDNYGIELQKYIGESKEYLEATIEDTLREALTQDDRILDVKVTDIKQYWEKQPMIDKIKVYKKLTDEERNPLTSEEDDKLITEKKLVTSSINQVKVCEVQFDVYCKQGIINSEVKVNVR